MRECLRYVISRLEVAGGERYVYRASKFSSEAPYTQNQLRLRSLMESGEQFSVEVNEADAPLSGLGVGQQGNASIGSDHFSMQLSIHTQ